MISIPGFAPTFGALWSAVILLLTFAAGVSAATDSYAFDSGVRKALIARDNWYDSVQIPLSVLHSGNPTDMELEALREAVNAHGDDGTPWSSLVRGLALSRTDPKMSDSLYQQAFERALNSAASLWVLFVEFSRFGCDQWTDRALSQIRVELHRNGVNRNHLIAQHLLYLASATAGPQAQRYAREACVFDPNSPWPLLRLAAVSFPQNLAGMAGALLRLGKLTMQSWRVQLGMADYLLSVLSTAVMLLAAAVLVAAALKYGALALHPVYELFPLIVPGAVRFLLIFVMLASVLLLGPLIAIWGLAFALWSHLKRQEKILLSVVLFLVVLLPLAARLQASVRAARLSESPLQLLDKSLWDEASPSLLENVKACLQSNPDNFMAHTAAAMVFFKGQHFERAMGHVLTARSMRPDDPVVLQAEGMIAATQGRTDLADWAFRQSVDLHPSDAEALFNLGGFLMTQLKTPEGAEMLRRARNLDHGRIDSFVAANDRDFAEDVPYLRQYFFPEYSPQHFWLHIFVPQLFVSWEATLPFWGKRFLGLGPLQSLWVGAALFVLMVAFFTVRVSSSFSLRSVFFWVPPTRQFKRTTLCEVCGTAMCSRCGRGKYCRTCAKEMRAGGTEGQRIAIRQGIAQRAARKKVLIAGLCDVFYPGIGLLYTGRTNAVGTMALLVTTSIVAALAISSRQWTFEYPVWVTGGLGVLFTIVVSAYLLVFLSRSSVACYQAGIFKDD